MSQGTKIFGFTIPLNQKALVGALLVAVLGVALYSFLGSSSDDSTAAPSAIHPSLSSKAQSSSAQPNLNSGVSRRLDLANRNKLGALKIKPVDPNGMVDPTLKLSLLDRVRSVKFIEGGRDLFEGNLPNVVMASNGKLPPIPPVKQMLPKPTEFVGPRKPGPPPPPPPLNVPLRYYGFVRPNSQRDGNRGYFMDGDNILMATEGDVLKSRFLIVSLTPNTARVEDIQSKQGQDLQLIPEAVVTQ